MAASQSERRRAQSWELFPPPLRSLPLRLCRHRYITLGSKADVLYVRLGLSVSHRIADAFQAAAQKSSTCGLRMRWRIFVKEINKCLYTFFTICGMWYKEVFTSSEKTVFLCSF